MIRAGVLGDPVSHSLSPILHGGWLKTYGIDCEYRAIQVLPEPLRRSQILVMQGAILPFHIKKRHLL
jgi:shikimate 5-dehydrogenase